MDGVQIHQVVAPVFATNCCVVVAGPRDDGGGSVAGTARDCVIVDPGAGVADEVARLVTENALVPRAVLATHGHVDHTWDAAELCRRYDVPLRLHAADAYRLADPFGTLGPAGAGAETAGVSAALTAALAASGRSVPDHHAPDRVEPFGNAADENGAGPRAADEPTTLVAGQVRLRAVHAPGHTEGSTMYVLDGAPGQGVVLAGDVLFAGGVGRTDLPGGDPETMARTLRDVVGRLDPALGVVPGHGPTTRVGHELATNPFLRAPGR